jgi:DNA-binding XRE family transcriptional regulator
MGSMTTQDDMDGHTSADDPAVSIGWAIKVIRTERGRSRKDLASLAGISYSYLGHVETGRKTPSPDTVLKIAKALGISTGDLLNRAKNRSTTGAVSSPPVSGAGDGVGPRDAGVGEQIVNDYDLGLMVAELADLARKMSPGDRERVLDLARRLAK